MYDYCCTSWDYNTETIVFRGTQEQCKRFKEIVANLDCVEKHVGERRSELIRGSEKERNALYPRIWNDSPPLKGRYTDERGIVHEEDRARVLCKEFWASLKEEIAAIIDARTCEFDKFVEASANMWVQNVLDYSTPVCTPSDRMLLNSGSSNFQLSLVSNALKQTIQDVATRHSIQHAELRVLKRYFNSFQLKDADGKVRDVPKKQQAVFERFKTAILERAQEHFELSTLLRDFLIHRICADRDLNFYSSAATDLLQAVGNSDVTVVSTATGSGKSTLMPLLLLASGQGYKRIAVTQPRRFAAESIQKTISKYHGDPMVGYCMSGKHYNVFAPIVFITDGLLRTMIGLDGLTRFDVVIIDEVHERSVDIDACIALLARCFQNNTMKKVILSSATFDEEVERPFRSAGAKVTQLGSQLPKGYDREIHYPDQKCSKLQCGWCSALNQSVHELTIIRKVYKRLHYGEQLLCFVPSTREVNTLVERLADQNIVAHALYSQQRGREQNESLEHGRVCIVVI